MAKKAALAEDRWSLMKAWRAFDDYVGCTRKRNVDTHEKAAKALPEAKEIRDGVIGEAQGTLDAVKAMPNAANAHTAELWQWEEALLGREGTLQQREHIVDDHERVVTGREADVQQREVEAEKTLSDLRGERARLAQLQEVLDAQGTKLDLRQATIEAREASHKKNVDNVNSMLK